MTTLRKVGIFFICLSLSSFFGFLIYDIPMDKISSMSFSIVVLIGSVMIFKGKKKKPQKVITPPPIKIPIREERTIEPNRENLSEPQFQKVIQEQLYVQIKKRTEIFWVADKHRTHPWSLMPGGCTVVVIYKNLNCFGYDKVKRPHRYLRKVSNDYICNILNTKKIETLESYIDEIYAVRQGETKLNAIWKWKESSTTSPWDLLEKYATQ